MQIQMDYGRNGLAIDVPDHADVFLVRDMPAVRDETAAIQRALRSPVEAAPLGEIVSKKTRVVIVHTDITRATPNARLLPVILAELEAHGVEKQHITLLNALGTHRPQTRQELRTMLGEEIIHTYRCLQHDAFDDLQLVNCGFTRYNHPIFINKILMEADLKILTGFIEPHFFAGYSGGPKAILPGVAGGKSIFANHSPEMIAHPNAGFNITESNPIWEEMSEVAMGVSNTFLVNVTLNRKKGITGVFSGDVIAAHKAGYQTLEKSSVFPTSGPYDVVITTNSGYPLDQNLYQCVKGLAAAKRAVRKGGAILMLAACEEGLPDHGDYARLLREACSPQAALDHVFESRFTCQDAWQVQIQAQVQMHADVFLFSEGLTDEQIASSLLTPCKDVAGAIRELTARYGAHICVLPQGPLTILETP